MTWHELLAAKRVAPEPTSKQELDELREVVARNLQDAQLAGLSSDGKFSMAYNAARTLANMVVRCEGYRVKHQGGGHYNTFLGLEAAEPTFAAMAAYLDVCRQ